MLAVYADEQGCLVEMPGAHLLSRLNKMRTGVHQGMVEETVVIVDMRESSGQRQLELPRTERESNRLKVTSCLIWAKRGEQGRERERGRRQMRLREDNKERGNRSRVWPEWLGSAGVRSWGDGSKAPGLEK